MTIASNGVDALRAVGADETALAAGFPTPTIMLRSTTGKNLGGARTGPRPSTTAADGRAARPAVADQPSRSATAAMPGSMARSPTWPNPSTS